MKICILNVLHEPFDKRMFQKIGRTLAAAGHEVVSICPADTPTADQDGIRFITIPHAPSKKHRLLSLWRLYKLGKVERADVYMAPEPESWVAALLIKFTRGGKVILDMHEHIPTEFAKFFPRFLEPFMVWLTIRFMRLFARFTDHIILTRESFDPPWKGLKVPRTTIINSNHRQPQCESIPQEFQDTYGERLTLIHQGIFGIERGSMQLLECMKILKRSFPDICCIVLGDYCYGSKDDYIAAIKEADLEDTIHMLDPVPYEKVPAYIAVADLGLILFQPGPLNHTLAMPHKLFDYMREGCPVLVPDFSLEVKRIVEQCDCGILADVANPATIAKVIKELLNDPKEMGRLGRNGRDSVEKRFNWQAEEPRLLSIIDSLEAQ